MAAIVEPAAKQEMAYANAILKNCIVSLKNIDTRSD